MDIFRSVRRKRLIKRCEELQPRLLRIARAWGCDIDLAHDIVQDTLVTALDKLSQLRNDAALESWLISILANCHRRTFLHTTISLNESEYTEPSHEVTPELELERERVSDRVRRAINHLSDKHRKVLILIDMEGFSYMEVADALEIRIGTVMSRLSRARSRLKTLLHDISEDADKGVASAPPVLRRVK